MTPAPFYDRGKAWVTKQYYEKALSADFSEAIRLDPKFVVAYLQSAAQRQWSDGTGI